MQEYIVNLWTQDRESSQPISMSTFQQHINTETGTNATFDSMWTQMQTIIGGYIALIWVNPSCTLHLKLLQCLLHVQLLMQSHGLHLHPSTPAKLTYVLVHGEKVCEA